MTFVFPGRAHSRLAACLFWLDAIARVRRGSNPRVALFPGSRHVSGLLVREKNACCTVAPSAFVECYPPIVAVAVPVPVIQIRFRKTPGQGGNGVP